MTSEDQQPTSNVVRVTTADAVDGLDLGWGLGVLAISVVLGGSVRTTVAGAGR